MRIGIVGGGPGGLFLAYLLKKQQPGWAVEVFEQNDADSTYGWGLVFSGVALRFIEQTDPALFAELMQQMVIFQDMEITHRGTRVRVGNNPFARIGRLDLLRLLQARCRAVDVRLHYDCRIDDFEACRDRDLLVGADGVNSRIRSFYAAQFQPVIETRPNRFAWYGTRQLFAPLSLIFQEAPEGLFIAHSYQYSTELSTFLVECDPATYERAGLEAMSAEAALAYVGRVFAEDLGGHPVLANRAGWFQANFVRTARMSFGNVALIGDAQRTVHFSIGSGTRMAMQDAIALSGALIEAGGAVGPALARYEEVRRASSQDFQASAMRSLLWYENVSEILGLDPWAFTYSYFTRTGKVSREALERMDRDFMAALRQHSPEALEGRLALYPAALRPAGGD
jgi:anthraniloyl-CoA monooxygenase